MTRAIVCFALAALCVWLACKTYPVRVQVYQNGVQDSTSQNVITSEVLNDSIPRPYPADNWWNVDVSGAPVDSNSDMYISYIGPNTHLHPDWGAYYGMPFCVVANSVALVPVDIYAYPSESDPGPYPIPVAATYDWRYVEQGDDHHLIMFNRDTGWLYELFGAEWTGTEWRAKSGAIFDTKVNYRRPEGWTSADASGIAILPGLVRCDDVAGVGEIQHGHRCTLRATNGYVWPANHSAGNTGGALPLGARLRLRASFPIDAYPVPVQRLLQAFKTYGLILTDNGSDVYITGTQDERWGDMSMWIDALATVTAGDFEVIQLGWRPEVTGIGGE